jgi:hypothetical protein
MDRSQDVPGRRGRAPVDEEARWQAYQAWLRRAPTRPGLVPAPAPRVSSPAAGSDTLPPGQAGRAGRIGTPGALTVGFIGGLAVALLTVGVIDRLAPGAAPGAGVEDRPIADIPSPRGEAATAPSPGLPAERPAAAGRPHVAAAHRTGARSAAHPSKSRPDPAMAVSTVRRFFDALGEGESVRALALVAPERRFAGSLSNGELGRYRSGSERTLRVSEVRPAGARRVLVRYDVATPGAASCAGAATVEVTARHRQVLVTGIRHLDGC